MRKFIYTILISFITFNLTFTSFASEDQPAKEGTDQKAGEKIIITESVNPIQKSAEIPKEAKSVQTNKLETPEVKKEDQASEVKKDEQVDKENAQTKSTQKEEANSKTQKPDMEKIEKAVDELVKKLDKNSNLSNALSDMQTIDSENKEGKSPNSTSKQTEAILKDYNEKIQSATTEKQKRRLEDEAANRINSIKSQEMVPARKEDDKASSDEAFPEKKKKILLEVKPDNIEDSEDERGHILALNPTADVYEEKSPVFSKPIVIVALVFVLVILVAIGIVIRNNDRNQDEF